MCLSWAPLLLLNNVLINNYFENVVKNLNIQRPIYLHEDSDPIANAIKNFEQYPSILKIKETGNVCSSFAFKPFSLDEIIKETLNLDTSKATQKSDIPTEIIKQNQVFFLSLHLKMSTI